MTLAERAAAALVGLGYGDALGVPYEWGSRPLPALGQARLLGGGLGHFEPGEWSDDTQLAICVGRGALMAPLTTGDGLDAVAAGFEAWFAGRPADVGIQTSRVLHDAATLDGTPAVRLRTAARALRERGGRTAGNGALMRTAPVALAHLGDQDAIAAAARAVAELTHTDPVAGDSCVLWSLAIDAAVRGELPDLAGYLDALPSARRDEWAELLATAAAGPPGRFSANGYTVTALQAAWASVRAGTTFIEVVNVAISIGDDTDTVAAIAGSLAGPIFGVEEIPPAHRQLLHGWPQWEADDLERLGREIVSE